MHIYIYIYVYIYIYIYLRITRKTTNQLYYLLLNEEICKKQCAVIL